MNPDKTQCQFRAVECRQHGRRILVGAIRAQDLARLYEEKILKIDVYSPSNPDGYQRSLSKTRSRRFGRFVQDDEKGTSPTSILIYARDAKAGITQAGPNLYNIEASSPESSLLYITDGQHRTDGFSEAFKEGWLRPDVDYDVPVTIMFWDPAKSPSDARLEEAMQFYTINQEQKRMRTDLAHRYIFRLREREKGPIGDNTPLPRMKKREYIPYAIYITDRLRSDSDSPWRGLISHPNMPSTAPISEGSFSDSLTPVIDYAIQANLTVGGVIKLLKSYWTAIFDLCALAKEKPEDHVLLKTPGVYSLHIVLPTLLIRKHNLGHAPSAAQFKQVMQTMGSVFTDAFWDSRSGDGAVTYGTGRKAFQELADFIIGELS